MVQITFLTLIIIIVIIIIIIIIITIIVFIIIICTFIWDFYIVRYLMLFTIRCKYKNESN